MAVFIPYIRVDYFSVTMCTCKFLEQVSNTADTRQRIRLRIAHHARQPIRKPNIYSSSMLIGLMHLTSYM